MTLIQKESDMPNQNQNLDTFPPPPPVVEFVIQGADGTQAKHELPWLPGLRPVDYETLGACVAVFVTATENPEAVLAPEALANIQTQFVIDRLTQDHHLGSGAPRWKHVYAERAAVAVWEYVRMIVNTIDRTSRFGWSKSAPEHLREAYKAYRRSAFEDAAPKIECAIASMHRAFCSLRVGQPDATSAELVGQVLDSLGSLLSCPHPEPMPGLLPMY